MESGSGELIVVSVAKVKVTVERSYDHPEAVRDRWVFAEETMSELLAAASQKADMVIVDYCYVDRTVALHFRDKARTEPVGEGEVENKSLTPKMLHDWCLSHDQVSEADKSLCLENLFYCCGPVYVHSYTPEGLHAATGTMEQRRRIASLAFPYGKINVIETRAELFNDDEFDWPGPSHYDAQYYPYQLGALFGPIVEKELYKTLLARQPESRRVFLVHGRAEREKEAVARLLERLGIDVVVLHEQPNMGRSILAKLRDYADVGYAVVLLTSDDRGGLAGDCESMLKPRARQNVVLELGFFLAKLGDSRVCCLSAAELERPSELDGILDIPLDVTGNWRFRLARELKEAGFVVDLNKVV